jgi:phage gpG-like protein
MADFVQIDASQLRRLMEDFEDAAERLPELMPAVAEVLVSAVSQEFETEGRGRWQKLADSTLESRRRRGRGAKILQDSGIFAGSIMPYVEHDLAEAFTNVPYAIFHTSDEPRTVIPYRNPFDIDMEAAQEEMVRIVLAGVVP